MKWNYTRSTTAACRSTKIVSKKNPHHFCDWVLNWIGCFFHRTPLFYLKKPRTIYDDSDLGIMADSLWKTNNKNMVWSHHLEANNWLYLWTLITFAFSSKNYIFLKIYIHSPGLDSFPICHDFSVAIHGDINKCNFSEVRWVSIFGRSAYFSEPIF